LIIMLASPKFRVYAAFGKPPTPDAKEFAVQVVRMDRSFYVWVGPAQRASQRMDNLSAALCRASVPAASAAAASSPSSAAPAAPAALPSAATIFKGTADDRSVQAEGMAQRICKLTGCVVFVSFNLSVGATPDHMLALAVEKVAGDLIKQAVAEDER
jgi:hypothetical protein